MQHILTRSRVVLYNDTNKGDTMRKSFISINAFLFALCISGCSSTINQYDSEGLRDGLWKEYYDNRLVRSETYFSNGQLDGVA